MKGENTMEILDTFAKILLLILAICSWLKYIKHGKIEFLIHTYGGLILALLV